MRRLFACGVLLGALLAAPCRGQEDFEAQLRPLLEAAHGDFVARRWSEFSSSYKKVEALLLRAPPTSLSEDTGRRQRLLQLEARASVARGDLTVGELERAVEVRQALLGPLATLARQGQDVQSAQALLDEVADGVVAATAVRIEASLAAARSAAKQGSGAEARGRVKEGLQACELLTFDARGASRRTALRRDLCRVSTGFVERTLDESAALSKTDAERAHLALLEARAHLAALPADLPADEELRGRLEQASTTLLTEALPGWVDAAEREFEALTSPLPEEALRQRVTALRARASSLDERAGALPPGATARRLATRTKKLAARVERYGYRLSDVHRLIAQGREVLTATDWRLDDGCTARAATYQLARQAHGWLHVDGLKEFDAADLPALGRVLSEVTTAREEAAERWLAAARRRVDAWDEGAPPEATGTLADDIRGLVYPGEGTHQLEGMGPLLARVEAHERAGQVARQKWRVVRELPVGLPLAALAVLAAVIAAVRWRGEQPRAPSALLAMLASAGAVVLFVGAEAGLARALMTTAERAALGLSITLALSSAVGVGLGYVFYRARWAVAPERASFARCTAWFVAGAAVALGGSLLVAWLLERLGQGVRDGDADAVLAALLARGDALLLCCVVVLIPVAEELVFRFILVNVLARALGPAAAILLSSVAFAACHLDVAGLPIYLVLGLALGTAYHRSGSLWVPVAIHVLNNLLATRSLG